MDAVRKPLLVLFYGLLAALSIGLLAMFDVDQGFPEAVRTALRASFMVLVGMLLLSTSRRSASVANIVAGSKLWLLFPLLTALLDDHRRRTENGVVIDRAKERLRFYKLAGGT